MCEESDRQRLKRFAAAAYDYEKDPRWAGYWSNILIPTHMASRSDVVDHFKRKFYRRFVDPDFVVEGMSSTSSSHSSRASGRSLSTSASEDVRPRESGSSAGTSVPTGRAAGSLWLNKWSILFSVNAWKPRAWNPPAIQSWFQTAIAAKDFIHFVYCLMFVTSQLHFKFALIPVLCWALEHVAKFLRHNFTRSSLYRKFLEKPCLWVEANTATLSILNSNAEILLGFLLIISLFSWQCNIIQTFMYWQLLKFMYHAPVTAGHHQSVWAKIGRTVNPYICCYVPFLNTPISSIQRWWFR